MPLLASVYIAVILLLAVSSRYDGIKRKEPLWYAALDSISDAVVVIMFIGYWCRSLTHSFGRLAPYLFLFSILWAVCTAPRALRGEEATLTGQERRIYERIGGRFASVCLGLPAYVFAGLAALREL